MKKLLKALLRKTPYRIIRAGDSNRFQAIDECLLAVKKRGYAPRVVIDGGANVGEFARLARRHFPSAIVHLVEPQPACFPALELLRRGPGYVLHRVALGAASGVARLSIEPDRVTTGAYIALAGDQLEAEVQVPVRTLDELGLDLTREDRALLKLDLQGFELEALRGAVRELENVELILCEVSLFSQAYGPSIAEIVSFLHARNFDLHDVASLIGRYRDNRAHQGDFLFARRGSPLTIDAAWS